MYVTINNQSPVGGNLSLLVSDSTIFPLFIDSLITGSWVENLAYQQSQFGYTFHQNTTSNQPLIWDSLGIVIDFISFTAIDTSIPNSKALEVKFYYEENLQFFVGRMFELGFPASDSIDYETGFVNPEYPEIYTSNLVLDTTRMNWVITEEPRNSIAMITFDASPIYDTTYLPLTLQTNNSIDVQAFLTLTLNTSGLGRQK